MRTLLAAEAEAVEAEFMYQLETAAPASDRQLLGIATERLGGGVVLAVRNDPTSYWSKALGLGFAEPVSGQLVDRILNVWRAERNPIGALQIAPEALPANWEEICETRRLSPGGRIAKMAAPIDELSPAGRSDLLVAPVAPEDGDQWARVLLDAFGMPHEGLAGMFAAMVGHHQFHPYGVWDGDTIVGGGTLFVHGQVGSLVAGAVHQAFRNRGAQTALIAARIARARELGCRWVMGETGQPDEGKSNTSMDNMLRVGMKPLYVRRNHVWRAP
ncbi:GNAT family N-acetyltransferase [Micromonospora sp. 067-2]|uniref:GNAT family N-acetyltransferase n=1 Tax=Micromonospora sp. 067-2 TaxID=2789270 RepID=UPI00397ACCA6